MDVVKMFGLTKSLAYKYLKEFANAKLIQRYKVSHKMVIYGCNEYNIKFIDHVFNMFLIKKSKNDIERLRIIKPQLRAINYEVPKDKQYIFLE